MVGILFYLILPVRKLWKQSVRNIMYRHTIINVDNKCLDLLLTDQEIQTAFARALDANNSQYIDRNICCKCWPIDANKECCPFWKNIFGLCEHCEDTNKSENCNG